MFPWQMCEKKENRFREQFLVSYETCEEYTKVKITDGLYKILYFLQKNFLSHGIFLKRNHFRIRFSEYFL